MSEKIMEGVEAIRRAWDRVPRAGIVLGSGLGGLAKDIVPEVVLEYGDIPNFLHVTAMGHRGRLLCGTMNQVPVIAMDGRYHRYEGYSLAEITLPVRVMQRLGIDLLILSNASGGLNPRFQSGDVMVIDDHINLMWGSPLIGPNDDSLGPRFPDMSSPYSPLWVEEAQRIARESGFTVPAGVYAAMSGPCYETRAEYRFLRRIGADVVGMSTVPEAIVAAHMQLPVLALSAVTNVCRPDRLETTSGAAVLQAAQLTEPRMRTIVAGVLKTLADR